MFREEDIVVLDFPPDEWMPNLFDIENAEKRIEGLLVNAEKGIWRLDKKETFIGEELWRYDGFFSDQLVGVYDPTERFFELRAYELITKRKELFLFTI